MTIGSFGDIRFYTEMTIDDRNQLPRMRTFDDMEHKSSVSYSEHKLHKKKPLIEFTNYNADEVSFKMTLSALLGGAPRETFNKLHKMMKNNVIGTLVIGTDVIGGRWVITDLSRAFKQVFQDGQLISCEVSVTLKEYN